MSLFKKDETPEPMLTLELTRVEASQLMTGCTQLGRIHADDPERKVQWRYLHDKLLSAILRFDNNNGVITSVAGEVPEQVEVPPIPFQGDKPKGGILYLCDRRACDKCDITCELTPDIRHARQFRLSTEGTFYEVDRK